MDYIRRLFVTKNDVELTSKIGHRFTCKFYAEKDSNFVMKIDGLLNYRCQMVVKMFPWVIPKFELFEHVVHANKVHRR